MVAHGFASDNKDAARIGVMAGVDMDMEGKGYGESLAQLVKEGKVPLALVNDAVARILRVKYELGLFDRP
jgi:beta-glucosidase